MFQPVVQVHDAEHYGRPGYLTPRRFAAYAYQIAESCAAASNILEIGPGNGIVSYALRCIGLDVCTLDIDARTRPDVVASALNLPFRDHAFEAILCCEVLEHVPFDCLERALVELGRVSSRVVVLTLPHAAHFLSLFVRLPAVGRRSFRITLPRLRRLPYTFDGEHYWCIGRGEVSLASVMVKMRSCGLEITKEYRIPENPEHHLFVLHRANCSD